MNASCGCCGSTVMPYRRYVFQWGPTATCEHCGQRVRLRGYGALLTCSILILGVLVAVMLVLHSHLAKAVVAGPLVLAAIVLDRWSWRALSWIPLASKGDTQLPGKRAT